MTTTNSSQVTPARNNIETPSETAYDERLTDVFSRIGRDYGYDAVSAEFTDFREFKIQWSRSYKFIHFRVSDYLKDAPEDVMEDLAETILARINGGDRDYGTPTADFVLSPDFSESRRPVYMERSKSLTGSTVGEHRNLSDSIDGLVSMGLVERDHRMLATWNTTNSDKAGTCSVLMRVVAVNTRLDDPEVSDEIVDFVLYSQYLHLREGAKVFADGGLSTMDVSEHETRFPGFARICRELEAMDLYI